MLYFEFEDREQKWTTNIFGRTELHLIVITCCTILFFCAVKFNSSYKVASEHQVYDDRQQVAEIKNTEAVDFV